MTDVFFSYSSKDRERVRPIRDALVAEGFDVFWDQEVPPGRNWDEWIRQHLDAARCAVVFWSEHSVKSDNVVHEATVAKNAGKLIPILLDPIEANQFPMGHYTTQGVVWSAGGDTSASLRRLREEVEAKAMRRWMRRKLAEAEARAGSTGLREELDDLARRVAKLEGGLQHEHRERARLYAGFAGEPGQAPRWTSAHHPGDAKQSDEIIFLPSQLKNALAWFTIVAITAVIIDNIAAVFRYVSGRQPVDLLWLYEGSILVFVVILIVCCVLWYLLFMRLKFRRF